MNELERYQRALTELSAEYAKAKIKLDELRTALEVYEAILNNPPGRDSLERVRQAITNELERCK